MGTHGQRQGEWQDQDELPQLGVWRLDSGIHGRVCLVVLLAYVVVHRGCPHAGCLPGHTASAHLRAGEQIWEWKAAVVLSRAYTLMDLTLAAPKE